jgi:hypothetical protein
MMPSGFKNFYFPLFLNIAYWGRQFRFHVKGYNPATSHRRAQGLGSNIPDVTGARPLADDL